MNKLTHKIRDPHRGIGRIAFDGDTNLYPASDYEVYQMALEGYYFPSLDQLERFKLMEEEVSDIVEYPPKVQWEDYSKFRKMDASELSDFFPGLKFLLLKQLILEDDNEENDLIDDIFFYATRDYHPDVPNLYQQVLRWRIYCSVDPIIRSFFDWMYGKVDHDRYLQLYIKNSNQIIPIMPFLQKCENECAYIFATVTKKHPLEEYLINYNDIMGNFAPVRTLAENMGFRIPLFPLSNNNDTDLYFISEIEKYLVFEPYQYNLQTRLSKSSNLDIPLLRDTLTLNKTDYFKQLYPLMDNQSSNLNNEESDILYQGRLTLLLNKYFEMLIS